MNSGNTGGQEIVEELDALALLTSPRASEELRCKMLNTNTPVQNSSQHYAIAKGRAAVRQRHQ